MITTYRLNRIDIAVFVVLYPLLGSFISKLDLY
ncbi:hypothetical protein SAMN05421824_2634 [Hyunsoonleella jejuensis]|uniref:Uncharacterized protein n=1 Tax=Hyunsoonleella jejuensis TaxID=419940 RepID=A0A1H9K6I9_9FLAO|nr:hypothetical protein SAMN05421824_2634 [Hyunsoonleella jejuensis]